MSLIGQNNSAVFGCLTEYKPSSSSSWTSYKERLEFYFQANSIVNDQIKRAIFLTSVGEETYDLVRSLFTPLAPKDIEFTEIIEKLDVHFNPTPNEIVRRYQFYKRQQEKNETISQFIAEIRKLSEFCNFTE